MASWLPEPLSTQDAEASAAEVRREVARDTAGSLGRTGRKVERALDELRAHQGSAELRAARLNEATEAVHGFFIQREACGMLRHDDAVRVYAIPTEVLNRLGSR